VARIDAIAKRLHRSVALLMTAQMKWLEVKTRRSGGVSLVMVVQSD